jgi:hypothetical protein
MQNVIILSVNVLNVENIPFVLSVVMLNVVAPFSRLAGLL